MSDVAEEPPAVVPLVEPTGGVPPVVSDPDALVDAIVALRDGDGPVAVDAERASGYRYSQRAYLVQLHRFGSGIVLIDPVACPDLSAVSEALAGAEWILHAASQDLPSLAGVRMRPDRLFDTELAARLCGFERVGLATMVELLLGRALAKEHSAVDWSRRPLAHDWLRYAALDVEVLLDLREALDRELRRQHKQDWAAQEFEAVRTAAPAVPRADPWRRTSGMHRVRTRRQLAVVRALWVARDEVAAQRDLAPGRVLPDSAIIAAATTSPSSADALGALPGWGGRWTRQLVPRMWPVLRSTYRLPDSELPRSSVPGDGPPPANRWPERYPDAAARLARARAAMAELSARHSVPVENLLSPDLVRRLAWAPTAAEPEAVAAYLSASGARPWQVELAAAALAAALREP